MYCGSACVYLCDLAHRSDGKRQQTSTQTASMFQLKQLLGTRFVQGINITITIDNSRYTHNVWCPPSC